MPLVVLHVCCSRVELEVALDHFIDCGKEILLSCDLPPRTDGEHAGLGRNTPQFCTCCIRTQSRDQFPSDVTLNTHALCMLQPVKLAYYSCTAGFGNLQCGEYLLGHPDQVGRTQSFDQYDQVALEPGPGWKVGWWRT